MKPKYLLTLSACALLAACDTTGGTDAQNARARATNAALGEAAKVLGNIAVNTLYNAAKNEMSSGKADFGSAASAALWSQAPSILSSSSVWRIVDAYSGQKLPETAEAAARAWADSPAGKQAKSDAIAAVLSTAAGAPPAK